MLASPITLRGRGLVDLVPWVALVALVALRDRRVSDRKMCCHNVIGDLHAVGVDIERIILSEIIGERV